MTQTILIALGALVMSVAAGALVGPWEMKPRRIRW
jgi:hypothetical protein